MASSSFQVAVLLIRPGPAVIPAVGVVVEAIDSATITAGDRLEGADIVATATTNEAGVASLLGVTGDGPHIFRARLVESHFIEVLESTATGLAGCWDAVIKSDGSGTDATLQDAIDRLDGGGGGSILICDILDEEVTFPADGSEWTLFGTDYLRSGIITTTNGGIAVTVANDAATPPKVTFQNLRLGGSGTGTVVGVRLGTVSSPGIGGTRFLNCRFDNGSGGSITHAIRTRSGQTCALSDTIIDQCQLICSGDAITAASFGGSEAFGLLIRDTSIESSGGKGYVGLSSQTKLSIIGCVVKTEGTVLDIGSSQFDHIANNLLVCTSATGHIIRYTFVAEGRIIGNQIDRNGNATTGDGIYIASSITRVTIIGNTFSLTSTHRHGIHLDGVGVATGLVIQGNFIHDCVADGIRLDQLANNVFQGVCISGNTIHDCGGNGITLDQNSASDQNKQMQDIVISANVIYGNTGDGIEFLAVGEWCDRFAISANVITSNGGWGINGVANADLRNSAIVGNALGNNTAGTINNFTNGDNGKVVDHNAA